MTRIEQIEAEVAGWYEAADRLNLPPAVPPAVECPGCRCVADELEPVDLERAKRGEWRCPECLGLQVRPRTEGTA